MNTYKLEHKGLLFEDIPFDMLSVQLLKQGLQLNEVGGNWIDAKLKTPDIIDGEYYSHNVLAVCDNELKVMCYTWVDGEDEKGWPKNGYVWANCYGDINGDGEWDEDYDVTHWMPLPSLPKK